MTARNNIFTTIRTEGALLPADLLQRISDGANLNGLTPEDYHHSGEKLNEAINRSWNALQAAWLSFRAAQERLPESDSGTSITRDRWLLPLFRELGYGRLQTMPAVEIDGRSYPISHGWEHVPVHLLSYKLELDRRTRGAVGAASASPHSLLQVFLNRSENRLWGFLSNGYKLRILRKNASLTRQAYVEFDLEAMMDGEIYSDFVLLWLLCHQSRVEGERPSDCWLEKWMKSAQEQGTRALDQLRKSVERAIVELGSGFLEHHANASLRDKLKNGKLNAQDYYRQLLRMVYRLLFLFVAEDRDLLLHPDAPQDARERYIRYYSTQRLRRMAQTFKGTRHADAFEALRLVMRLLSGEKPDAAAGLGLVSLGSFLFSDRAVADIISCQLSNQRLLAAIRALSLTYDDNAKVYRSVDYKNLGPEELGSIFESLLELHPQINISACKFSLETAAGNERKTTGSYYTPESLVQALLDSALDPVLNQAVKKGEQAILDLKVCDPACGSGHFLIAAANRIAKALAFVRTGEEEPSPVTLQQAKRDVISHCIYGVDINPMAVELCKVSLWLEALEPGKPISFLDHRILVGNSLLGTTPKLMAEGIPQGAFKALGGDDPKVVSKLKKQNERELANRRTGQLDMFAHFDRLTRAAHELNELTDDTLKAVQHKESQYAALANDPEYIKARLLADAWCAAFVWERRRGSALRPMTDLLYRHLQDDPFSEDLKAVREYVVELKERYHFFHWHLAFPDVFSLSSESGFDRKGYNKQTGWYGGFDVVLGNPPWERIKLQEEEWFEKRDPRIAKAPNADARKRMIEQLKQSDLDLYTEFKDSLRKAEGESHFVHESGRYPLCGRGDVNTYAIFAETVRHIIHDHGRVGLIVPSGIATDNTTKFFFQDVVRMGSLVSLYDFENRKGIFEDVHRSYKFSLLTLQGKGVGGKAQRPEFAFFLHRVEDLDDPDRRLSLSAEEIAMLNPNTRTLPIFRSPRDVEITKAIHQCMPILVHEGEPGQNLWGASFLRMFDMSNDSGLFRTRDELESAGFTLRGNHDRRRL
ncbi:MAG: N-6 DNA methylase, partial [Aggregatilineales bacterium]